MAELPKIAIRRLNQKSAAGIHPDPNLISAFSENALPRDARAQVMQHLAQCTDCREIVFLSSPDQAATLTSPVATPSRWLTWPVLRWGAAVAAVVVVVAAVSMHRPSSGSATSPGAIQMTDAPAAQETVSAPAPISPVTSAADAQGQSNQLKKRDSKDAPTLAPTGSDGLADRQSVPGKAKEAAAEDASNVGGRIGGGTAPDASAALRRSMAMSAPTVAPRWALTADGTLQRSSDFGRTWQTVPVAGQAGFHALAASGRDIWVGGSKGALYHSTDGGQNWIRVEPVAAGQALADDIVGVEFPDSLHGRLTTSSNAIWATDDGGQSWRKP